MDEGLFVTGTDTGIGKTWSSVTLLHYFRQQGIVLEMKPVASYCIRLTLRRLDRILCWTGYVGPGGEH